MQPMTKQRLLTAPLHYGGGLVKINSSAFNKLCADRKIRTLKSPQRKYVARYSQL